MIQINIDWLDDLLAPLDTPPVDCFDIDKIFTPMFISKYTPFSSISDLFTSSGFVIVEQNDLQKVDNPKFNDFIQNKTKFDSWDQMVSQAGKEFLKNRIIDI